MDPKLIDSLKAAMHAVQVAIALLPTGSVEEQQLRHAASRIALVLIKCQSSSE